MFHCTVHGWCGRSARCDRLPEGQLSEKKGRGDGGVEKVSTVMVVTNIHLSPLPFVHPKTKKTKKITLRLSASITFKIGNQS